jgi:hypothetical protein
MELFNRSTRLATEDIPEDWTNKWTYFPDLNEWQDA